MDKQTMNVSELFLDIFRLFNVSDQRGRMKQLTKKELYFLLISAMDNHNEDNPVVIINLSDFELEIKDKLRLPLCVIALAQCSRTGEYYMCVNYSGYRKKERVFILSFHFHLTPQIQPDLYILKFLTGAPCRYFLLSVFFVIFDMWVRLP